MAFIIGLFVVCVVLTIMACLKVASDEDDKMGY